MATIQITLFLLLAVALVTAAAKWVPLPAPLLLIAGGAALTAAPGMPVIRVDPDVFFLLFIPPLLFGDGWSMPKRELLQVMRPVLLLAFGLVFLTVVAIGLLLHWLIPSLPLAAAFALGAIVSPTDALATSAATGRHELPARVTTILNGESLINDASGLVAFKFAVAATATGAFSLGAAAIDFGWLAAGGAGLGLAVAAAIGYARTKLTRFCLDDPTIQTVLSLLTPYAAYLVAEAAHASGILAVVAAGLYAGVHDARHTTVATRRHAWEVWTMVLYAFNGLVFLLLGLELPRVLGSLVGTTPAATLAQWALAVWLALTLVRLFWVYPAAYLPRLLSPAIRAREGPLNRGGLFLVGWSGLRGAVTMAAALSIPLATAAGAAFPGRDLLIFLAGTTILLTLVLNGLSLPYLIRWLDVRGDGAAAREERAARIALAQAAVHALEQTKARAAAAEAADIDTLIARYAAGAERIAANAERRQHLEQRVASRHRIELAALAAQRRELERMYEGDDINDETLRALQTELDQEELMIGGLPRAAH